MFRETPASTKQTGRLRRGKTVNATRGDLVPGKVQAGDQNYHSLDLRKRDSWSQTNVPACRCARDRKRGGACCFFIRCAPEDG